MTFVTFTTPMTFMTSIMSPPSRVPPQTSRAASCLARLSCVLFAGLLSACGGAEDEGANEGDDGELEGEPELGQTPLPSCDAAMFSLAQIEAELRLPAPDLDYILDLYRGEPADLSGESPQLGGTAVQRWVREVGARIGRVEAGVLVDDAAIEQALDAAALVDGDARKRILLDVLATLREVALLDVRARLAAVADALPDPERDPALAHAEWDMAWCVWDGALHGLATAAGDDWEPTIVSAFEIGSDGISGDLEPWAADEFATKPSKQSIEKRSFGVVHRQLLARATAARDGDPFAAREGLGLFTLIEDRVRDRNSPAVDMIRTMLAGDAAAIDPDLIAEALAIAFVKRARKYCDEALLAGSTGSAEGVAGVEEGLVYTKIILPVMADRLADQGFDGDAYLEDWVRYGEAVRDDDGGAASQLSDELITWNCAFQDALGITACTDSADELP